MNSLFQFSCIFAALLGLTASQEAIAQNTGAYFGLGAGAASAKIDEPRITAGLIANGASSVSMSHDERSTGYKIFGGYHINQNWAVEAGYFNLGQFSYAASTIPLGTLDGQIKLQGLHLDLVSNWSISERWSSLARVGVQVARAQDRFRASGVVNLANSDPRETELNLKLGVGLQYQWSPSLLLRTEIERYRVNDAVGNRGDINHLTLSMVFPFGRTTSKAVAAAPVVDRLPERVPPTPIAAPAPPVVAQALIPAATPTPTATPAVAVQKVSLSADSLFDFDQAALTQQGLQSLAQFAGQLKTLQIASISIEGHTDRLGSESYNQQLSLRRAEAIKQYLVDQTGVASNKVTASGKASIMPITKAQDCKGKKPTAQLIACLQPDRRVDIRATGNK